MNFNVNAEAIHQIPFAINLPPSSARKRKLKERTRHPHVFMANTNSHRTIIHNYSWIQHLMTSRSLAPARENQTTPRLWSKASATGRKARKLQHLVARLNTSIARSRRQFPLLPPHNPAPSSTCPSSSFNVELTVRY
jgi:hypothetical protein